MHRGNSPMLFVVRDVATPSAVDPVPVAIQAGKFTLVQILDPMPLFILNWCLCAACLSKQKVKNVPT